MATRLPDKQTSAHYSRSPEGKEPHLIPPPRPFQFQGGFFKQDKGPGAIEEKHLQPVLPRFGLNDNLDWNKLWNSIDNFNEENNPKCVRKVIFLGRHGQGAHNLHKSSDPDTEAAIKAVDPELTQIGYMLSRTVNAVWQKEREDKTDDIGLPSTVYCSPLTRCLSTNTISLAGLPDDPPSEKDVPVTTVPPVLVVEKCRERFEIAPEAERRSGTYIKTLYPDFKLEKGFDMTKDPMYTKDENRIEIWPDVEWRAIQILRRIYTDKNSGKFVYITTHSGFIKQLLKVVGHNPYPPKEGCIIPFVCDYTPSEDIYLPLVCKILDDTNNYYLTIRPPDVLLPNVPSPNFPPFPPPIDSSDLIVQDVSDSPPLIHRYKWILEPRYVDEDTKTVQYAIQNEWTYNKKYVTSFSDKDNVDNLVADTNRPGPGVDRHTASQGDDDENQLFYIEPVGSPVTGPKVYEIIPVDRTDKVFGVDGNDSVKLVDKGAPGDVKWKIIGL